MLAAVEHMLLRTVFLTALVVPGFEGLVQTDQLEDLQQSYQQTRQERRQLVGEMRTLEQEYEAVVDRIDELKSEGTTEIQNRMSVEQLLSRSQTIANHLERQQRRLTKLDEKLGRLRSKIVGEIDRMTEQIERQLGEVPASERRALVDQLNELREIRKKHRAPLPAAPNPDEIRETLQMASQMKTAHPDQMAAAADELEDTEDQVRKRLEAVNEKLEKLQNARTLSRRARTFESEEQFFDEQSRPRVVGRHRESSGSSDETTSGTDDRASSGADREAPAAGGGSETGSQEPPPSDSPDPNNGLAGAAPGESPGAGDKRNADDSFGGSSPEASDQPEAATQAPSNESESTGGGGGAFSNEESVVLESDADPSTSISSGFVSESELEDQIDRLERERKELEDQAEQLEQKANTLRDRADEMKDLD